MLARRRDVNGDAGTASAARALARRSTSLGGRTREIAPTESLLVDGDLRESVMAAVLEFDEASRAALPGLAPAEARQTAMAPAAAVAAGAEAR